VKNLSLRPSFHINRTDIDRRWQRGIGKSWVKGTSKSFHHSQLMLPMPPTAAELLRDISEPAFYRTYVSAQDTRAMLRSDQWMPLESRNQQIVFFHDFVQNKCDITLFAVQIAKVFGTETE
jgi:hypothetical protein